MAPSHGVLLASEGGRRLLYALTNFSAANFLQSAVGGGEPGVDTGFGVVALAVWKEVPTGSQMLVQRVNGAVSAGWYLQTSGASLRAVFVSGAGVPVVSASYTIVASDLGRVIEIDASISGGMIWLIVNRQLVGAGVAITGYTPAASEDTVWSLWETTQAFTSGMLLSSATYRGNPSVAQRNAYADETRILGDLPTTIQGATITHRHSLRDQLRAIGGAVTSGQTAPATLEDTITRAAADALARQGSPTVVTIDTSRDGRRTLGVQGWSASNFLSVDGGLVGSDATGLRATASVRVDAVPSGNQMILHRFTNTGWYLSIIGAVVRFTLNNNAVLTQSAPYTITTADLGKTLVLAGQYDGAGVTLYVDGVATGAAVAKAMTPALVASSGPMQIGQFSGAQGLTSLTVWGIEGGLPASASEIRDQALAIQAAGGRVQPIAGKTQLLDDFHASILAAGETIPTQFLDRIGTNHLTRVGGHRVTADGKGIAGFSAQHFFATAPGLGLPGSMTGFWGEALIDCSGVNLSVPVACQSGNAGWMLRVSSVQAQIYLGNGTALTGAIANWSPGGLRHLAFRYSPADAKIYLLVDGVQVAVADFAGPFSPATVGTIIGALSAAGSTPLADSMGFYGASGGYGEISNAELAAAAASALANRRVVGVAGKTLKRWDGGADIVEAGGAVPNAYLRERVAGVEHAVRAGAPLQVAQRTERVWSYETRPIAKVGTVSTGNRWETDAATPLGENATAGIIIGVVARIKGNTSGRIVAHSNGGFLGWNLASSAGSILSWTVVDGASAKLLPNIIAAADGKLRSTLLHIDATSARAFANRAQAGATLSLTTGYTPADGTVGLAIGSWAGGTGLTPDVEVLGVYIGQGPLTLAQEQAWEDACLAADGIVPVPGVIGQHLWRFDRASGLTLLDQIGSLHIPAIGSPVITDVYSRAWAR